MKYLRFAPAAVFLLLGLGGVLSAIDEFDMTTNADVGATVFSFLLPLVLLVAGLSFGRSAIGKLRRSRNSGNAPQGRTPPVVVGTPKKNEYSALGLPPWNSIRLTNFELSRDQFLWGTSAAQRVVDHFSSNAARVTAATAVYMPEVGTAFGSASQESINPVDTQHYFNLGWMVAEVEDADGMARPGFEADAVRIAFNILGQGESDVMFHAKPIEAGYFAMRTRVSPTDLHEFILTGSR